MVGRLTLGLLPSDSVDAFSFWKTDSSLGTSAGAGAGETSDLKGLDSVWGVGTETGLGGKLVLETCEFKL